MTDRYSEAAVRAVLAAHETRLGRYALRLCGDEGWAADAVQETFLRLCVADPDDVGEPPTAWLFTVCRSRVIDRLRKEGRMQRLGEHDTRLAEPGEAPDARAARGEQHRRLLDAVATLPAKEREAVRLKFQEGMDYRAIARVLGATENHVGVLIHRGVATLRRRLADRDDSVARPSPRNGTPANTGVQ